LANPRHTWAELFHWQIDRAFPNTLFEQIARQIRNAVLSQQLRPGTKLPSTRALAVRLGVSRASVVAAYNHLLAEGVVAGKVGAGTFIASDLPNDIVQTSPHHRIQRHDDFPENPTLGDERAFTGGRVLVDARTVEVWRKLTQRTFRSFSPYHLGYTDPRGAIELREAVCDYVRAARGVNCDVDQILITSGTQQAIDLTIRTVLTEGDSVWVENPAYPMTVQALRAARMTVHAVAVDAHGMDVAQGMRLAPKAKLAFVTPSHQFPTGAVLSMARRLDLIRWAKSTGAWIFEDDYASEYRYSGRPLTSLQSLDTAQRVIYVGTFNKVLFPGLRLGYVIVPRPLLKSFLSSRYLMDRQPSSLHQPIVATFLAEGHFLAHLRRMRQMYTRQRDVLAAELTKRAGDLVDIVLPDQGLHLLAYLRSKMSDVRIEKIARESGVITRALSRLYLAGPTRSALMLGFTGYPPQVIIPAAAKLAKIIRANS